MRPFILAGLVLAGCGPGFQGKVSGYGLAVQQTLFATTTDTSGAAVGAVLLLSDQANLCTSLAAAKAPPDITVAAFMLVRRADGTPLAPDVGDYTVAEAGTSGAAATGVFIHTDANGTNVIPIANRAAVSGLLSVTELTAGMSMTGQFDGKFGSQDDSVNFAFNAQFCGIDSATIAAGFLGAGTLVQPTGFGGATGSKDGDGGGSCTDTQGSVGTCLQYTGSSYTPSSTQTACTTSKGTWSAGLCATSPAGLCTTNKGTATEYGMTVFGESASQLQSTCAASGGSFSN